MATINKIIMSGRLAVDPKFRQINERLSLCELYLAVSNVIRQRDGSEKEEVCFVSISVWGSDGIQASQQLKKGSAVTVEGRLKEEKWIDKTTNQERRKHVIVADNIMYLEKMPKLSQETEVMMPKAAAIQRQATTVSNDNDFNDELPF